MRLGPQVSRSAACGRGFTTASHVTITTARCSKGTAHAVPFFRASPSTIPAGTFLLLLARCSPHNGLPHPPDGVGRELIPSRRAPSASAMVLLFQAPQAPRRAHLQPAVLGLRLPAIVRLVTD